MDDCSEPGASAGLGFGTFAAVMATGIVSQAMLLNGAVALSDVLLGIALAAYLALAIVQAWRVITGPGRLAAEAADPRTAFGLFAFAAGSNVLASRVAAAGHAVPAWILLAIGASWWLVASYSVPWLVARQPGAAAAADGSWFLAAVGAQSVAVAVSSLPPPLPPWLGVIAVGCWSIGLAGYALVAVLIATRILTRPPQATALTPAYWVAMGATAISVLAGARLAQLPGLPEPRPVLVGISVVAWALGTWLIPLLIAAGIWRHLVRRVTLGYEHGLWSLAFPVGMYGVASRELGVALRASWLVTLGRSEAWLALAVWLTVTCALAWRLAAVLREKPAEP